MKADVPFHWSKDFVEHLRTVHFALTVVSVALIIAGANTQDKRSAIALTQIEEIAKFEKQWARVPAKLYEYALASQKQDDHWDENIAIMLPERYYRHREIDTYVNISKDIITAPDGWKFSGKLLPAEVSSLADFRDFWNEMHQGMDIVVPLKPDKNSSCSEDIRTEHPDGSKDLEIGDAPDSSFLGGDTVAYCKVGTGLMSVIGGPAFQMEYQLYSYGNSPPQNDTSTLMISLHLPDSEKSGKATATSKGDKIVAISDVFIKNARCHLSETVLSKLFFSDWKQGDFATAFPELDAEASGFTTLEINDAVHRVEAQAASGEKSISLVGFTIPLSQVSRWGALVLLSTQLYFWLHLHELVKKTEPKADGWNVAWIGIYRTRTAFIIALFSSCVLPLAAAISLEMRVVTFESVSRGTVIAGCVVLGSGFLAWLAAAKLRDLRRGVVEESNPYAESEVSDDWAS